MKRFTIALSGVAENDATRIRDELAKADTWELVDGPKAYLLVVDIDTTWGHMDWLRATANGQHVAAYTSNEQVRDADLVLKKPLQTQAFAELLQQVGKLAELPGHAAPSSPKTGSAPALHPASSTSVTDKPANTAAKAPEAAMPAVDSLPVAPAAQAKPVQAEPVAAPVAAAPATPEPEPEPAPVMTLREALLANAIDHPVSFHGHGMDLYLDPERGGYIGPAKLLPIQGLLDQLMDTAKTMDEAAIVRMRESSALPLTRLLWFAALSATPGRLAQHLDKQSLFHLERWPQIEREFPRHFRIATAMMKQPGSVGDIASAANAPEGDVADFINAYQAAGFVVEKATANAADEVAGDNGKGKGMFSRLRQSLSRSGEEPETP